MKRFCAITLMLSLMITTTACHTTSRRSINPARNLGRVVVSPNGPRDGGDFGPHTPGTKTSGLQEALDYAKQHVKDVYVIGGSWTHGKNRPAVYYLYETLHIPWMQDFRMDAGHCVIAYKGQPGGSAMVFDSQMSCYYRFGLICGDANGPTVVLKPTTAGPDKFKVITSTEFHFNALVGGGGAWPGGDSYDSELNLEHPWTGIGLLLDGSRGPIDGNKISIIETVGCDKGIWLKQGCTNNWIECPFIHLCKTHIELGSENPDSPVRNNRIEAFMHSQGIPGAIGTKIWGQDNLLTLSSAQMSSQGDIILEHTAANNLITTGQLPNGITNRATKNTNRIITSAPLGFNIETPEFPDSEKTMANTYPYPIEAAIVSTGSVSSWTLSDANGNRRPFDGKLYIGQTIHLDPGDSVLFTYSRKPTWTWRALR